MKVVVGVVDVDQGFHQSLSYFFVLAKLFKLACKTLCCYF